MNKSKPTKQKKCSKCKGIGCPIGAELKNGLCNHCQPKAETCSKCGKRLELYDKHLVCKTVDCELEGLYQRKAETGWEERMNLQFQDEANHMTETFNDFKDFIAKELERQRREIESKILVKAREVGKDKYTLDLNDVLQAIQEEKE